jgi:uncharacterized circularly permuted ATP-grasp superfamily protein
LVVNSSQGGGSKDTWVLKAEDTKDEDDDVSDGDAAGDDGPA